MSDYVPGTPSWVDLATHDVEASAAFYTELFGWTVSEPNEQAIEYRRFEQDGLVVAGLMPVVNAEHPTAWSTYITVQNTDATSVAVQSAGGTVVVEPVDVLDMGRMAFFADPAGAVFGVWQPGTFGGARLVNEPNSLCWNEVMTRDIDAVRTFYSAVFGWVAAAPGFDDAPESYVVWELDGRGIGGGMQMGPPWFPDEVPAHWNVNFAVADCEAIAAKAADLGATITAGPMDMPVGRFANILDPQGAPLSLMQLASS